MNKIDVHVHTTMWTGALMRPNGKPIATPDDLRETYKELGVDKAIVMSLLSPEYRFCIQSNEETEYISKTNSDMFYWCMNLDPRMGSNSTKSDFSAIINYYKERGAVGIGELTANLPVDHPLMDNLFYHCAACNIPVTIHLADRDYDTYGIIDDLGLPRLERMLKKYPDLKIVGHSQCFWSEISSDVTEETRGGYPKGKVTEGRITELMRNYSNLYADLSADSGFTAISRDPDFSARFIEEFGDRLMYATDFCRAGQTSKLGAWLDDAAASGLISEENYANICRKNAIRIFGLDCE